MSLRILQRRVAKLEKANQPIRSPFVILYGTFEAFVDHLRGQAFGRRRGSKIRALWPPSFGKDWPVQRQQ
jgi:hypothetical protein